MSDILEFSWLIGLYLVYATLGIVIYMMGLPEVVDHEEAEDQEAGADDSEDSNEDYGPMDVQVNWYGDGFAL